MPHLPMTRAARLLLALLGSTMLTHLPALAQEAATDPDPGEIAAPAEDDGLLSPDELDELLAAVALYPDALLAQVMLATTYPLDVVKADRALARLGEATDAERSDAIREADLADPVKSLAAGFPELIGRMVEHLDWTEQTGEALIVQTDDVLSSLQRLRAQAKLMGYLEDNAAMTVEEDEDGDISISSSNPEVVYVPQYDPAAVYTQPAPTTATVVTDDDDWTDALATGAIVFGSAMIIDEIFDDDWDDWNGGGHWYGGHGGGGNDIDWDGDINIDNGINIGNGNGNGIGNGGGGIGNGNGNGIGNGNGGIGNGGIGGGGGIAGINRPNNDLVQIDRDKFENRKDKLGDLDPDRLDRARDKGFNPSEASREAAREKAAKRKAAGGGVATLPSVKNRKDKGAKPANRPAAAKPAAARPAAKPAARPAADRPKVSKPKAAARPAAKPKAAAKRPAAHKPSGGSRAKAASSRGKASKAKRGR